MKEDYKFWNGLVHEFEEAVNKAETELIVNSFYLQHARIILKTFPKPKEPKNPITK